MASLSVEEKHRRCWFETERTIASFYRRVVRLSQSRLVLQVEMVKDNWKVHPIAKGSVVDSTICQAHPQI